VECPQYSIRLEAGGYLYLLTYKLCIRLRHLSGPSNNYFCYLGYFKNVDDDDDNDNDDDDLCTSCFLPAFDEAKCHVTQ